MEIGGELRGDLRPLYALWGELKDVGCPIRFFPGEVSTHSGKNSTSASCDWHEFPICEWQVFFPHNAWAHQVFHELVHIHRYEVQGVPWARPTPAAPDLDRINVGELNNDFDHAFVVPQEIASYPEAEEYWAEDWTRMFPVMPTPEATPLVVFTARLALFRGWLVLPVAMPRADITSRYASALRELGCYEVADKMSAEVQAAGVDKAAAMRSFRNALGLDLPPEAFTSFGLHSPSCRSLRTSHQST
jgi:hypothetical protein